MSVYALGSVAASGLNELRVDKLISKDSANTFFEYDSANTKFEMNLDQITNNHLPVYACRAWVNFNGTGTVAIRASGNVSSITDNGGSGDYTVNFTTAMPTADHVVCGSAGNSANKYIFNKNSLYSANVNNVRVVVTVPNVSNNDDSNVNVAVFC